MRRKPERRTGSLEMTNYQVRYYREPPCPIASRHQKLPLDLFDLAHAAVSETLLTGGPSSAFSNQLAAFLTGKQDLTWKGNGPGVGRELRRSFSNIHGRFFARAYLETHEDVRHLTPIEGNKCQFAGLDVRLRDGQKGDMPDWVGLDSSGLVVAEAKGTYARGNWSKALYGGTLPQCLQKAQEQVKRVQIDRGRIARDLKFNGWSVASRWATEKTGLEPWLAALGTGLGVQTLTDDALRNITLALQRTTFSHIVRGLGYSDETPSDTIGSSAANPPTDFNWNRDAGRRVYVQQEDLSMDGLNAVLFNGAFIPVKSNDELAIFRDRGVQGGQVWLVTALDNALDTVANGQILERQLRIPRAPSRLSRNGLAITKIESATIAD